MARDVRAFLWDIQTAGERVGRFTHGANFVAYASDAAEGLPALTNTVQALLIKLGPAPEPEK